MRTPGSNLLVDFNKAIQFEWLQTNGLGGWSGSTLIGCNSRRYHGLLTAAVVPPTERMVLLSKLDETIITGTDKIELGCNQFKENTIHPIGYRYLESFTNDLFPTWRYRTSDILLEKAVAMVNGENTTLLLYEVLESSGGFQLEFLPLMAGRNYHSLQNHNFNFWWDVQFENGIFYNKPNEHTPGVYISIPGAGYHHQPCWYYDFHYSEEKNRGLDYSEDLFNHGKFAIELKKGDKLGIIISTENPAGKDAWQLLRVERLRKQSLLAKFPVNDFLHELALAADQFIVKRNIQLSDGSDPKECATIIAGYHWFTDWGRDTMIAMPGLCLTTGRFEEAKKILLAFAHSVNKGMLPNRFPDNNEVPEYNTVDATLWFFVAIHQYLEKTGDNEFVISELLPVLKEIIKWHFNGTRYNIHVDEDGLLYSGEKGQQLTWMDARIGEWVVTPRMGKPVEIQALWFNALNIYAHLLKLNNEPEDANEIIKGTTAFKEVFRNKFWSSAVGYLFDVIDENGRPDPSLRPNQLFAISLPWPLIDGLFAEQVLQVVEEKLLTPAGLRSLSPDDEKYIGKYEGTPFERDSAYHQGTVWTWLLGPFIDAIINCRGHEGKTLARKIITTFSKQLKEGCIGNISEIADGDPGYYPRGCIAQAWSVGELLRVILDHKLFN